MKASHEQHFRVLSGIDDDILTRTSDKRAVLWWRRKQRIRQRRTLMGSVATVLVASMLLLVLLPMLGSPDKQIPIYRGMSVSSTATAAHRSGEATRSLRAEPRYTGAEQSAADIPETLPSPPSDLSPRAQTYFAAPGEDIYITVHIDNPDNFEILSFTLNGKKYSSYMFEEGSTMEELVLKVNVGTVEGFRDYTIDAIKYVDGEQIKDVRMAGERTVTVGVAADKNRPAATVDGVSLTYTSLSATVNLPDVLGLVRDSGGVVLARLYHGDTLCAVRAVETPVGTVTFSSLLPREEYRLDIVAYYDACDGLGIREQAVATATYETPSPFRFTTEVRDAASSKWCHLYGKLHCDAPEFSILSVTYGVGASSVSVDPDGFALSHGEGLLTVRYLLDGKEHTEQIPVRDGMSAEDVTAHYTVLTPYIKDDEHPELDHYGVDLGAADGGTSLAVYALTDGYGQWEQLPDACYYVVYSSKGIDAMCTRYRLSRVSAALESRDGQQPIAAGTFLGTVEAELSSAQDPCTEGLHCHLTYYPAATGEELDPVKHIPLLK